MMAALIWAIGALLLLFAIPCLVAGWIVARLLLPLFINPDD